MLAWIGPFEGAAAYPMINRNMTAALERQSVTVLRNIHNEGAQLAPVVVGCAYPPFVPNVRHPLTAAYFTWEFPQLRSFSKSFLKTFDQLDILITMSEWVAEQLQGHVKCQIETVPLGFDPVEFHPQVEPADWHTLFPGEAWTLTAEHILLWVGGTDQRHGLDIAVKVLDLLPPSYHLVAKWGMAYPAPTFTHERLHYLSEDLPSLAPVYRAADMLLHTARGVGFALPVLEAIACGLRVVSTDLPPVREYGTLGITYALRGEWQPFQHHVHLDCNPVWWEPDAQNLADAVLDASGTPSKAIGLGQWRTQWTWDNAAVQMKAVLGL